MGIAVRTATGYLSRSNTIGFIGLGAMGAHMFKNLVQRSGKQSFVICDVNQAAIANLLKEYAKKNPDITVEAASNPKEVAIKASKIISMVPTSKHVRDVYLGETGVIAAFQHLSKEEIGETLCMDESTIEQSESISIATELKMTGAEMVDAPVSGGVIGAKDGTLTIMVGGSEEAFSRVEETLNSMARKVVHCGKLGTGLAAKISNNMLLGITMIGVSESMLLGKKLGLAPQTLAEIINTSTGACWSSMVNNPVPEVEIEGKSPPAKQGYKGGFLTKLTHKDLVLAVNAARSVDSPLQVGELAEQLYRPLAQPDSKFASLDFSSIYKALEEGAVKKKG